MYAPANGTLRAKKVIAQSANLENLKVTGYFSADGFAPTVLTGTELLNIPKIEVAQGKDARFQVAWTEAANVMFSNLLTNSNLIEANISKFISNVSAYDRSNITGHQTGFRSLMDSFTGIITNPFSSMLSANVVIHKDVVNGQIVAPWANFGIYESNVEKSHKYYGGYRVTANTNAWFGRMDVQKVDSSNITANTRYQSWSVAKGVFALTVAAMVDKGIIGSLDDNISNYFSNVPTVANGRLKILGKDANIPSQTKLSTKDITVRHVITESSGIPAFSPFGNGQDIPMRMTSDNLTLDLSDFNIAANISAFRATDPFQFVSKDIQYAGAQTLFANPFALIGGKDALNNTVSTYVQNWFDTNATNTLYLDQAPGDVELYQATTQIGTALIEKIYAKNKGTTKNYHEIVTELILEPIDLTANDFCMWQDKNQAANVQIEMAGPGNLVNFLGSNAAAEVAAFGAGATFIGKLLSSVPVAGPMYLVPTLINGPDGAVNAYYKTGERSPSAQQAIFNFFAASYALASGEGPPFTTSIAVGLSNVATLLPDLTGQVSPIQFYDYSTGYTATMDTYARIFSLVSNNGYYKGRRVFGAPALNGLLRREDGKQQKYPLLYAAIGVAQTPDVEGLYPQSIATQSRAPGKPRRVLGIHVNGDEIPARLTNAVGSMSNTHVNGLANLYLPASYTYLENFFKTDEWGSNVFEKGLSDLPLTERIAKNDIILTGGAGGLYVYMDRTTGYTMVNANGGGTEVKNYAADLIPRMFFEFVESGPSDFASTTGLTYPTRQLQDPLVSSVLINRNTIYAKPAESLLRVNKLEIYPVGGLASNVVTLTADTYSNLVVSDASGDNVFLGPG